MPKFRSKPLQIEAIQFKRDCFEDVIKFTDGRVLNCRTEKKIGSKSYCEIKNAGHVLTAVEGDWIIKADCGDFYICDSETFEKTYERAE